MAKGRENVDAVTLIEVLFDDMGYIYAVGAFMKSDRI